MILVTGSLVARADGVYDAMPTESQHQAPCQAPWISRKVALVVHRP